MKIAVTARGRTLDSEVDPRLGRARYFFVLDTESGEETVIDNIGSADAVQGAGIQAAQSLVSRGVEAVLTGNCGPKAFRVFSAAGVEVYIGAEGTVGNALRRQREGALQTADNPNVSGHW